MNMLSKLIHRSQLIEAGTLRIPALSPAPPPGDRAKFGQNHFVFDLSYNFHSNILGTQSM